MNDIEIATENINDEDDIIEDFEDWYYTVWDETDANNIFNKFVYWSLNICHVSFFFSYIVLHSEKCRIVNTKYIY